MTNEEKISNWKSMTAHELWKKYTPKLLSHELTPAQYKTILSYAKDKEPVKSHDQDQTGEAVGISLPCPDTSPRSLTETILEQFPGSYIVEETPERKMSQKARLLELLLDGKKHTTNEIKEKVFKVSDKSCYCNIHGRASDLRKEGWIIPDADSPEAKNEKGEICYQIKNPNKLI